MGHRVSTGPSPWTSEVSIVNLNPHPPRHCSPYSLDSKLELPRLGWAGLPRSVILCSLWSIALMISYRMHAFYCAVHMRAQLKFVQTSSRHHQTTVRNLLSSICSIISGGELFHKFPGFQKISRGGEFRGSIEASPGI
jgi:hypothetical protein